MDPMLGGGEMILEVFHDHSTFKDVAVQVRGRHDAHRAAGRARRRRRLPRGARHGRGPRATRRRSRAYALDRLLDAGATDLSGPKDASIRGGAVSFWYKDVHPHDLATILNEEASRSAPVTTARSS